MVTYNHIICVGAVYIDTILTIPHFPIEDEKLRAQRLVRRRGGNTANTLEVLKQLLDQDDRYSNTTTRSYLHLLSVFPAKSSPDVQFIRDSLPAVNLDSSIFRPGCRDAASSYILQNAENLSRTIVSVNELPELTEHEFISTLEALNSSDCEIPPLPPWRPGTFHFEGRIPDVTFACVRYLRKSAVYKDYKISVECEKPERTGIIYAAQEADIVFYSKLWAVKNGFANPRAFLEHQIANTRDNAILCVTWGAEGAVAVRKNSPNAEYDGRHGRDDMNEWAFSGGYVPATSGSAEEAMKVVDTIGAGDTFIAGILFGLERRDKSPLQHQLDFACTLAGRKVYQEGFSGLGKQMWNS
ncbi:ketohexokinase-like protein [Pyrenochaeta sp. DS3sAY3a]|nr:ketohexokinase-like protein [Pyrenochaeta sp. DS3sAY3a]